MPKTTTIFAGSRSVVISARNDRFPKLAQIAALRILVADRHNRAAGSLRPAAHNPGGSHENEVAHNPYHPFKPVPLSQGTGTYRRLPIVGRVPSHEVA